MPGTVSSSATSAVLTSTFADVARRAALGEGNVDLVAVVDEPRQVGQLAGVGAGEDASGVGDGVGDARTGGQLVQTRVRHRPADEHQQRGGRPGRRHRRDRRRHRLVRARAWSSPRRRRRPWRPRHRSADQPARRVLNSGRIAGTQASVGGAARPARGQPRRVPRTSGQRPRRSRPGEPSGIVARVAISDVERWCPHRGGESAQPSARSCSPPSAHSASHHPACSSSWPRAAPPPPRSSAARWHCLSWSRWPSGNAAARLTIAAGPRHRWPRRAVLRRRPGALDARDQRGRRRHRHRARQPPGGLRRRRRLGAVPRASHRRFALALPVVFAGVVLVSGLAGRPSFGGRPVAGHGVRGRHLPRLRRVPPHPARRHHDTSRRRTAAGRNGGLGRRIAAPRRRVRDARPHPVAARPGLAAAARRHQSDSGLAVHHLITAPAAPGGLVADAVVAAGGGTRCWRPWCCRSVPPGCSCSARC